MAIVFTKAKQQNKTKIFLKDSPQILMFCGNGYSFGEYFKPIIEDLIGDYRIKFLQADYHMTALTIKSLEDFSKREKFSYQIVHALNRQDSRFNYHREISRLIENLSKESFNSLIVNTDFNLIDRYLISFAKSKRIKVVVIHANVMHSQVLRSYRKNMGIRDQRPLPQEFKGKISKLRDSQNKIGFIFSYIFKRVVSFPQKISLHWRKFMNYYLWPGFFSRIIFPENKYDRFHFTCGRADRVICYDPMEVEALKTAVPTVRNVYLARHPSSFYRRTLSEGAPKKLLVLLTSYLTELPPEQFHFWIESIKRIVKKVDLDQIDLRFHPRTDKKLTWPKKLIETISNLGVKLEIVDNDKDPLAESAANYVGVVGTVSGSIRTARTSCKGFVIGLLKAGGDSLSLLDQDWMLGASEGISWVETAEEIQDKHLKPFSPSEIDRPTVAEVIKKILQI